MFGRKENEGTTNEGQELTVTHELAPTSPVQTPRSTPALARRVVEMPGSTRRASSVVSGEDRKLIVGKGLSVAGEITSCDILVVEGKVEAKLNDGKLLEIAEAGQFRGSVEIENADIAGRFDGQLVVHGRLTVRSTGRISGMVKYGELEINAGGQIIGEMQVMGGGAQAATGNSKGSSRYAEDDRDSKSERKSA
jgi:cytoskeletal protein CcmA (bactofilin family)